MNAPDYLALLRQKKQEKTHYTWTAKTEKTNLRSLRSSPIEQKNPFFNPPPRPNGKHQGKSWGQWNGWIVGASEAEKSAALAAMPDHWRFHVQAHLDSVNLLRKRAEGTA